MKRSLILLSCFLILAGCGKVTPEKALTKMHEAIVKNAEENTQMIQYPPRASAKAALTVKTEPIAKVFEGKVDMNFNAKQKYDFTNLQNILLESVLDLRTNISAPASLFGVEPAKKSKKVETANASADLSATIRSADRKIALNISKANISYPTLPAPFALPKDLQSKWYGALFDEVNEQLRKSAKEGDTVPTIDEILKKGLEGNNVNREEIKKLIERSHLWKGLEILPGQDGNVRVRVESDKEALKGTVAAIEEYVRKASGPSWKQLERDNRFQDKFAKFKDAIDKDFGSVRGVLAADKTTYVFRGFEGEVLSNTGAKLGDVKIELKTNGDALIELRSADISKPAVVYKKVGTDFSFAVGFQEIFRGTVTPTRFTFTFTDPEKKIVVFTMDLPLTSATKEALTIENGTVEIPSIGLRVTVESFRYAFTNAFKDVTMAAKLSGTLAGAPLFTATFDAERKVDTFSFSALPTFAPFGQLQQDMIGALMAQQQPAPPAEAP
ncbi:MAG: hypothetical protein WC840_00820 [Candidatus Peribacteraceae bacterium]